MREDNAPPEPEKRDSGSPGAENAPARKPIKEHPRGMRFDDRDLQAISHIMDQFPHLKNQNDAVRFAVKHLASQVLPKPIRFRSLDPEELFEAQRLVDDCLRMHKQNRLNLFKVRPKTADLKAREIKALQAIEKETAALEKISRLISKQCLLSAGLTPSDAENIKAFIGTIDNSIQTAKGTDKQIYIPRYELVKKVLTFFLYRRLSQTTDRLKMHRPSPDSRRLSNIFLTRATQTIKIRLCFLLATTTVREILRTSLLPPFC